MALRTSKHTTEVCRAFCDVCGCMGPMGGTEDGARVLAVANGWDVKQACCQACKVALDSIHKLLPLPPTDATKPAAAV